MSKTTDRLGNAFILGDNPNYIEVGEVGGRLLVDADDISILDVRVEKQPGRDDIILANLQRLIINNGRLQLVEGDSVITENLMIDLDCDAFKERTLKCIIQIARFYGYYKNLENFDGINFTGRKDAKMPELLVPILQYNLTDCLRASTGVEHEPIQNMEIDRVFAKSFYRQVFQNDCKLEIHVPFNGNFKESFPVGDVIFHEYDTTDSVRFVSLPKSVPLGSGSDEDWRKVKAGQKVAEVQFRLGGGRTLPTEFRNKFSLDQFQTLVRSWWLGRTVELTSGFIHVPYRNCLHGYQIKRRGEWDSLYDISGGFYWRVDEAPLSSVTQASVYLTEDRHKIRHYKPLCALS